MDNENRNNENRKKEENNNKRQLILAILGVIALVVVTAGVSYAFFTYAKEGATVNTISTGTLKFLYTENSSVGNGINIQDALPMSDSQGIVQTGVGNVFDFTIDASTDGAASIAYEINAIKQSSSTLPDNVIKISLSDTTGGSETLGGEGNLTGTNGILFSNLNPTPNANAKGYRLYTGVVPENQKNYTKTFRLRMWIDETADFSPAAGSTTGEGKYNGQSFSVKINVYANANVITSNP